MGAGRASGARPPAAAEAAGHIEKALALLATLPEGATRDRRELTLRLAHARALTMAKGWGSPEMGEEYARARELCRRAGNVFEATTALLGLRLFHLNRAEIGSARDIAEEIQRLAERRDDGTGIAKLFGHQSMGISLLFQADFAGALRHLRRALEIYDPATHRCSPVSAVDARVNSRSFVPWALLFQGHPDRALAEGLEALADARALSQPYALAFALHVHCLLRQVRGDRAELGELAAGLVALAAEQGFPHFVATGTFFRGWALFAAGGAEDPAIAEMRRGLAAKRATGAEIKVPYYLGLLAAAETRAGRAREALPLLAEALARVERTGERWFETELHRLQGEALLAVSPGDRGTAEACFRRALAAAERQGAKWWGLRAATSFARLRRDQGRRAEARDLLAPVYAVFTEGFALPDLVEARALLEELGAAPVDGAGRRQDEVRKPQGPDRLREPVPGR